MANITITDLHPVGSDLFMDSESFMNELSDAEINGTKGGISTVGIVLLTAMLLSPIPAY